ncbi:MAG: fructose-6-phosphate aldolase [Armatimonadota bacterium]
MKFFVDTANIGEIKEADSWGVVDGVTTNPTLVAREGNDFETQIRKICEIMGDRPVSAEVVSLDTEGMVEEARNLATWADNIVVKIPMTKEGMAAVQILSQEGIKTNITLVFTTAQALIAAKAGGTYCSPFLGRIEDMCMNQSALPIIEEIADIYRAYDYDTQIIVASVRRPEHVQQSAVWGAHVATVPFDVMDKMFKHPLTDRGLEGFLADWEKLQEEIGS